jgi:DNA-binding protein H-NS
MKPAEFEEMNTNELWALHDKITRMLEQKIRKEKMLWEERLRLLGGSERRSYPPVHPKYRNPERPFETWAGRGKRPRWLVAQLKSGKRIDDFRI